MPFLTLNNVSNYIFTSTASIKGSISLIHDKYINRSSLHRAGVSVATQLEEKEETITTIMIRNIPNKYTQAQFKAFLDTYIPNDYDFLYLRVDFQNKVSSSIN